MTKKFVKVEDIRHALKNQNEAALIEALTSLRNQLSLRHDEGVVQAGDERLLLVKSWIESGPGVQELLELWERTNTRQLQLVTLIVSTLSATVVLLTSHYTYHSLASPLIKNLLSAQWASKLNSYLTSSHNELILVTLKLYNALSSFASGRERKAVMDAFAWEVKSLPKLFRMRRRTKKDGTIDVLQQPDIRTLYILFLLSFVDSNTATPVKSAFLEQRQDMFLSIFKGLLQDPYTVVRRVLEVSWTGIWCDPKIKRTTKIGLFNEATLNHIIKLYERTTLEGDGSEQIPADVAHYFLLAICTRPGSGVCFKDRGWYYRDDEGYQQGVNDFEQSSQTRGRIYNKILANILKGLKVNENVRHQELALRVLRACPELVAGYWPAAALTLEPRLSSRWIANIAFFGSVISLPVPQSTFLSDGTGMYTPTPPSLNTIMENILPSMNIKNHFTRGLQSSVALVQHCTAIALAKCLVKFDAVVQTMRAVQDDLEETEDEGQWAKRRKEVEREVGRRVPDFQVIVGLSQQKSSGKQSISAASTINPAKAALLAECAQRLLWLYHKCLPNLVAEARFDPGKLVQGLQDSANVGRNQGLHTLCQVHILRSLQENDQFSWSGKSGSSRAVFSILMQLYVSTESAAVRSAVKSLLQHSLSATLLFQHDPNEVSLWLNSLPSMTHMVTTKALDDTPLSDEGEAVISFLDDCAQRCMRTPYRYLEDLEQLFSQQEELLSELGPVFLLQDERPSIMLVATLEQLDLKLLGNHMPASHALSVVSFVRRLVWWLAGKTSTLRPLFSVVTRVETITSRDMPASYSRTMCSAIRREVVALRGGLENILQPALEELFVHLPPSLDAWNPFPQLSEALILPHFGTLFICSGAATLGSESHRSFLVELLFSGKPSPDDVKQALRLVHHRLSGLGRNSSSLIDLLALVTLIVFKSSQAFSGEDNARLCHFFIHLPSVTVIFRQSLPDETLKVLHELLVGLSGCQSELEKRLLHGFAEHWVSLVKEYPESLEDTKLHTAAVWIHFADVSEIMDFLHIISSREHHTRPDMIPRISGIVDKALYRINDLLSNGTTLHLGSQLNTLLLLQSMFPDSCPLESVIAASLEDLLPLLSSCHLSSLSTGSCTITSLAQKMKSRWNLDTGHIKGINVKTFLTKKKWTASIVKIVTCCIYASSAATQDVVEWLDISAPWTRPISDLAPILCAIVDSSPEHLGEREMNVLRPLCQALCIGVLESQDAIADDWPQAWVRLAEHLPLLLRQEIAEEMRLCLRKINTDSLTASAFRLSSQLGHAGLINDMLEKASTWIASQVSLGRWLGDDAKAKIIAFNHLVTRANALPSHVAEPIVTAAIHHHLDDSDITVLIQSLVEHVSFKPATINRFLQNIIQHPNFFKLCRPDRSAHRDNLIHLLHQLFHLYPTNTCQPSHLEPLKTMYMGTMSVSDRKLLSIHQLFETTRKISVMSLLSCWSPSQDLPCRNPLEAIQNLDPARTFRTCLRFPQHRPSDREGTSGHGEHIYDPLFIVLLLAQMLSSSVPTSTLAWVQLFRTNVISLLIRTLSSHDGELRALSLAQIAGLYYHLQSTNIQERRHILYLLDMLKDCFSRDVESQYPARQPAYVTLYLAHTLRSIFYPSNFLYPLTARFLLQRSELDVEDVHMLYTMLYSASDQRRKERLWIVRFLSDGMVGGHEWRVLKRRHTWELMASVFCMEEKESSVRRAILELLANITCNEAATTTLVLRSSLLSWVELQLQDIQSKETIAWVKILENILAVMDVQKLDNATKGEWRLIINRCVLNIMDSKAFTLGELLQTSQLILRLSQMVTGFSGQLIQHSLACLKIMQSTFTFIGASTETLQLSECLALQTPHHSRNLWNMPNYGFIEQWGCIVEMLWQATIKSGGYDIIWKELAYYMSIWAAITKNKSFVANWTRREIISNVKLSCNID